MEVVNRRTGFKYWNRKLFIIFGLIMVTLFFIVPLMRLLYMAISDEKGLSTAYLREMVSHGKTWSVIQDTLLIVSISTVLAAVLGIFIAWVIAYVNIRGKKIMQLFIFLPLIIPSYITTLAFAQFFGGTGLYKWLTSYLPFGIPDFQIYSMSGIVLVMALSHYPLIYMMTVSTFRKIPRDMELAARSSGMGPFGANFKIILPLAAPGVIAGCFLAFLASLDNFGIPAFLGIPARISVLSTYIYEQIIGFGTSAFSKAAVLSLILIFIALTATFIQWLFLKKSRQLETSSSDFKPRYFLKKSRLPLEIFLWLFFVGTGIVPLVSMFMTSLLPAYGIDFSLSTISLKNYSHILSEPRIINSVINSLKLALMTTASGLLIGTAFAYNRIRRPSKWLKIAESAMSLPYALPGTVLALAMIIAWMEPVPGWNPGIYGTMQILFIAYFTRFLILQIKGSMTAFSQVDVSMEEAARISGANSLGRWKDILIPLILPGLISGALLVFLTALTELTVSSLLWSTNSQTIGVMILGFENAGNTNYSTAFSSLIVGFIILFSILVLALQSYFQRKVV